MKMNLPAIGEMEMGFDGKTAWSTSAGAGPTIHDGVPKSLAGLAKFNDFPLARARLAYVGRREIGPRTVEAIRAVYPDSQVAIHYFDVKTGLMAGMDPEGASPPPAGRMTISFDDYQRFGRVLQSTKLTTLVQGHEMVVRTLSVSFDPISDSRFEPPAAVRELLQKALQR